jgi:hypothetical protein
LWSNVFVLVLALGSVAVCPTPLIFPGVMPQGGKDYKVVKADFSYEVILRLPNQLGPAMSGST